MHRLPQPARIESRPPGGMADRPHNTEQAQANEEPCLKCHIDKRGPFVFEHAAVRIDGCETCHNPHGSVNAKLLKRPVVFTMCLECHNGVGKFGPLGGIPQPGSDSQPGQSALPELHYLPCADSRVQRRYLFAPMRTPIKRWLWLAAAAAAWAQPPVAPTNEPTESNRGDNSPTTTSCSLSNWATALTASAETTGCIRAR